MIEDRLQFEGTRSQSTRATESNSYRDLSSDLLLVSHLSSFSGFDM